MHHPDWPSVCFAPFAAFFALFAVHRRGPQGSRSPRDKRPAKRAETLAFCIMKMNFLGYSRPHNMKLLLYVFMLTTLSLRPLLAASCPAPQPKDASALVHLEQNWAQALEGHDADAVGCILAEEFQDADPNGKLHGRAATLAQIPHRRPGKNML